MGNDWGRVCGDPEVWRRALPVDPDLGDYPDVANIKPSRFGRLVSVESEPVPQGETESTAVTPASSPARLGYDLRRALLGPPLRSTAIARERMRKLVALPILSADALSSVAYGPEAMLAILVLGAGAGLNTRSRWRGRSHS